jgi:hypothetical protein
MAQVVEYLPSKLEALSSNSSTAKKSKKKKEEELKEEEEIISDLPTGNQL